MIRKSQFCLLVLALVIGIAGSSWAGIELSEEEIDALSKGELIARPLEGSGQGATIAGVSFALINSKPDVVWKELTDVSAWTTIFPNTFESKIMASSGTAHAVKMQMGNRIIALSYYLTVNFDQPNWLVTFELNKKKPSDIEDCRGSLRLLPQPGDRTLVVFSAMAKVPFRGLIKLMGQKVMGWIEHRILSVPKRLQNRVYATQTGGKK